MTPLTHDLVRQIAREEAEAAGASYDDVLGMACASPSKIARQRAMERLEALTGCSSGALARIWGCDRSIVSRYRKGPDYTPKRKTPSIYDQQTQRRFRWAHGNERAASIIAGTDPQTLTDVAAWRALGGN